MLKFGRTTDESVRPAMSRRHPARFDHVMQTEDVSERSARDTEPLSAQDDDDPAWVGWMNLTLGLVLVGLFVVICGEFGTRTDSDGIEHQFDMTWGERIGLFFGAIAYVVFLFVSLLLVIPGIFMAMGWICSRTWEFVRPRRAARSRHVQPPAN